MNAFSLRDRKRTLREAMRRSLTTTPEAMRRAAPDALVRHLDPLLTASTPHDVVALFVSLPAEIDTRALFKRVGELGLACAVPRVTSRGLCFHLVDPRDPVLVPGRFGLREPPRDAPPVDLGRCRLIVVPGLAFDRDGHRLGYGKGYYDAAFAGPAHVVPGMRVGICFDHQLQAAPLPREPWDVAVDAVCTPSGGLLRCGTPLPAKVS